MPTGVLGHDIDLGERSRGGVAYSHIGEILPACLSHRRRSKAHSSVSTHKMPRARSAGIDHPTVVVAHDHEIELGLRERIDKITEVQVPICCLDDLLISKDILNYRRHGGWNCRVPSGLH